MNLTCCRFHNLNYIRLVFVGHSLSSTQIHCYLTMQAELNTKSNKSDAETDTSVSFPAPVNSIVELKEGDIVDYSQDIVPLLQLCGKIPESLVALDAKPCVAVDEAVNGAIDEAVDEAVDEVIDEAIDEAVDEAVDEVIDEAVDETKNTSAGWNPRGSLQKLDPDEVVRFVRKCRKNMNI
jgi:hypothetical protein